MKRNYSLLLGAAIIAIGVGYLCNALFNWNFSIFFDGWWTLFLIIPALVKMIKHGAKRPYVTVLLFGIFLFIICNIPSMMILPSCIILLGVLILYYTIASPKIKPPHDYRFSNQSHASQQPPQNAPRFTENHSYAQNDSADFPYYSASLSKITVKNSSNNLSGGQIEAFMGVAEVDCSMAIIREDCTITISATMGAVNLILPQNVKLNIVPSNIMGSTEFSQASSLSPETTAPTLTVKSNTFMGAVTIQTQ